MLKSGSRKSTGKSLPPQSKLGGTSTPQQTSPRQGVSTLPPQHTRNTSQTRASAASNSARRPIVQKEVNKEQLEKEIIYQAFRGQEEDQMAKTNVLLAKVYYMLDHKQVSYKLECELEYLMTFLTKRQEHVKAETLNLLHKLCANQSVASALLKEQNFHYLIELSQTSESEDVRSTCFKIFGCLSTISSKQAVKQLFYQAKIIKMVAERLRKEVSEDVLSSMLLFLMQLSSNDIYLELITQEMEVVSEILTLLNYRKNRKVRRLAYGVLVNLLCVDEMRKSVLKQTKVDVLAKLISIIGKAGQDSSIESEDIVFALKALSNALHDYMLMVAFLQHKGHAALAVAFESEDLRVKEVCLALYIRLALPRTEQPNASPMMTVVLEADLISDVLSLPLSNSENLGVIRNMLVLLQIMLLNKNEKAIEQMKAFDIILPLLNILTNCSDLAVMSLSCLGLLSSLLPFQQSIKDKNLSRNSILDSICISFAQIKQKEPIFLKPLLRGLQVYLLSFDRIDGDHLEIDQTISLIQTLNDIYDQVQDPNGQYYIILILKRLSEMQNKQIAAIINSLEQYAQQIIDSPTIYRSQQEGFVNDLIEAEISKFMTYYSTEDLKVSGMNTEIVFFGEPPQVTQQNDAKKSQALSDEIIILKKNEQNMIQYINEIENEKLRLENEIKTFVGVNFNNNTNKSAQTDFTHQNIEIQEPQEKADPKIVQAKMKENIQQIQREKKELENKNDYLQDRIIEMEQDIAIRDKALQKFTQGTQLAETISSIKDKIRDDLKHKFDIFKSTIKHLEGVIDTNSKLIKDLTEAIQDKNLHNQSLTNEDKVKQGKILSLQNKVSTFEKQLQSSYQKETQMKMLLEKVTFELEGQTNTIQKTIQLPELQSSSEQLIIREMHEQLIEVKVENLKMEEQCRKLEIKLKTAESKSIEEENELSKLRTTSETQSTYVIRSIQKDPQNTDITIRRINEALAYIDKTMTRHNFKEELVNFYEDRLNRLNEKYEQLLINHQFAQSNLQLTKIQNNQLALLLQENEQVNQSDLLSEQWSQADRQLKRIQEHSDETFKDNKLLRVRLQENEETLAKYRKLILFDQSQYDRIFKLRQEVSLSPMETSVLQHFTENHEKSEFLRLSKILDIVLRSYSDLEFQYKRLTNENLKNEFTIVVEQRETELRQQMLTQEKDYKIVKLESKIQLMEDEMRVFEQLNKPDNAAQISIDEAKELLLQLSLQGPISNEDPTDTFITTKSTSIGNKPKKVQVTNLVQTSDGRKPRIANDYNKKVKQPNTKQQDIIRELSLKLSLARDHLLEDQSLRYRQASDSVKQIEILKQTIESRYQDTLTLTNDVKRILNINCEMTNQLSFKDYQLSLKTNNNISVSNETTQKIEGLMKVNNFIRRKDLQSREECDLLKHQLDKADKERVAIMTEHRKLNDQVVYLQNLLKTQREQFRKGNNNEDGTDIPDDDIVKYLVQIDELNQKNSELEYMMKSALQSNIDKDKLFRGAEEVIEQINMRLEQTSMILQSQFEMPKLSNNQNVKIKSMPAYSGPDQVFERLRIVQSCVDSWHQTVTNQMQELKKQKDFIESMRPENQTLTQAEHQAKLEKYLNIYSARIQTLSSIIASYQRHFKSLEDQIRDIQGVPQTNTAQQSVKNVESSRIESLKRMINLKDILIKHQQSEIECIKKAIIGDKFDELLIYVSVQEKEALRKMREFDMQMKVVSDYERQMLLVKDDKGVDEQTYLKIVNCKVEEDLLRMKELFSCDQQKLKVSDIIVKSLDAKQIPELKEGDFRDFFEHWLTQVQNLLKTNFDQEKCQQHLHALNQEIPLMVSIISQAAERWTTNQHQEVSIESEYLKMQVEEQREEMQGLQKQVVTFKDRCNFLRAKNQQLQENNVLIKKFLNSKKPMSDEFKSFYKEDLLTENQYLRTKILSLTPYNEKLALQCGTLRKQVSDLQNKLLRQDDRHLSEQILFQTLEQTLLDTQRTLIEKDGEVYNLLKSQRDLIFKGSSDKALELLLKTCEALTKESLRIREANWQFELQAKSLKSEIEGKSTKIKESKQVLKEYQSKLSDLEIECEKMKVMTSNFGFQDQTAQLSTLVKSEGFSKEKLSYELGGRDGANTALQFLDAHAQQRDQLNKLLSEIQNLKVQNTTLMILAEDKNLKLLSQIEEFKTLKKHSKNIEDKLEKYEFLNQRLQDDFLVQQQSLDVYIQLSFKNGGKTDHAFNKCIENAQTIATLLQDCQRQRTYYYTESIQKDRENRLLKEQLKIVNHKLEYQQVDTDFKDTIFEKQTIQEEMMNGIVCRYEKEMSLLHEAIQNNQQLQNIQMSNNGQSPSKQNKNPSVIDSPPYISAKKGGLQQQHKSPERKQTQTNTSISGGLHHFLNCQLQINTHQSTQSQLLSIIRQLRTQRTLDRVLLTYYTTSNDEMSINQSILESSLSKQDLDCSNLKLQNIYLSRYLLYSHRAKDFPMQTEGGEKQIETLMSQEIDKLKIENKLLQDRNEKVEDKLISIRDHKFSKTSKSPIKPYDIHRIQIIERELEQQSSWITKLEQELLSKNAQIEALSRVHNNFSQIKNQPVITATHETISDGDNSQALQNMRAEYNRIEQNNQKLHEKIYLLETRNQQKEVKVQSLTSRIRELEKNMLQFNHENEQGVSLKSITSHSEVILQQDIDEIWRKFSELNDLKNSLYERNDSLLQELETFKTHFSKYEAQDLKKQQNSTFQAGLYHELTSLRDERDLLQWQLGKQLIQVTQLQVTVHSLSAVQLPMLESELQLSKDRELALIREVASVRDEMSQGLEVRLQVYEGARLREEVLTLQCENARLRRENGSLEAEVKGAREMTQQILEKEYTLKKRLVEAKNELVHIKVQQDMGEYQSLIIGKQSPAKKQGRDDHPERVRVYVEDLTVMRESLLKIEFRNIELEEVNVKKTRETDNLQQQIKDLQAHLKVYQKAAQPTTPSYQQQHQLDLQRRLMQEKWNTRKLKSQLDAQSLQMKDLSGVQDRYYEEVKEHQRLHADNQVLTKSLKEVQKQLTLRDSESYLLGDLDFYETLKEKYLSQLSIYIDEVKEKSRQLYQAQEVNRGLQDQMISLTIQSQTFDQERVGFKLLIEQVANQKVNDIDYFVTTAQHEEGLSKLEAHIMNQRKKLSSLKSQLDISQHDKDRLEQSLRSQQEIVRKLEKHTLDYNSELTQAKDELVRLRGERERYEQRVSYMWERLDFQQRIHHRINVDNPTIEQVIKVYKDEIIKVKSLFTHLQSTMMSTNISTVSTNVDKNMTKSYVTSIENDLKRLKNKEQVLDLAVTKQRKELDEVKLHIRLADMLRKTVGVSQHERENMELKFQKKRAKSHNLKEKLALEIQERERISERTEFLERQFTQCTGVKGFVKADQEQDNNQEGEQNLILDPREVSRQNQSLKMQMRELEANIMSLRQQNHELNMSLKYYDTKNSHQASSSALKTEKSISNRQARAITPVRIRDMQIKTGGLSQRLRTSKQIKNIEDTNQDFYYGQNIVDPIPQNEESNDSFILERHNSSSQFSHDLMHTNSTKLPQIGNMNYQPAKQIDQIKMKTSSTLNPIERRNMTPLPIRPNFTNGAPNISNYSTLINHYENNSSQQPVRALPRQQQNIPIIGTQNKGQVQVNFETVEATFNEQSQQQQNHVNSFVFRNN